MKKPISFFFALAIIIGCATAAFLIVYNYDLIPRIGEESGEPSPTPPKDETAGNKLTLEELMNAEYYVITYEEKAQLENGYYQRDYGGLPSGLEVIVLENNIAFGDLNSDKKEDAAVIVYSSGGGTGTFRELAVVINKDGDPYYLTSTYLGDRVKINSISINSGIIILDITTHTPEDPMCCPTLNKIVKYELVENQLVEI